MDLSQTKYHKNLADYFVATPYFLDGEKQKKPNIRKCAAVMGTGRHIPRVPLPVYLSLLLLVPSPWLEILLFLPCLILL